MGKIGIIGMGIVSAIGNGVAETLQSLRENRSGIAPLQHLQTTHTEFPCGEVKLSNSEMMQLLGIPENKPFTRTALMGILAVREALFATQNLLGLKDLTGLKEGRGGATIAFINGTTVGGMDKSEQYYLDFLDNDTRNAYISTHDCGACTEMIADYFGIFSSVDTISTACSSAANAILLGAELLKAGKADIVVAGGAECLTKFHLNGFNTLMILDKEPCRPFDATRAGLNLGEGAGYLVMTAQAPKAPQAPQAPLNPPTGGTFSPPVGELEGAFRGAWGAWGAVLSGYANTCDAYHQTASSPDGDGAYRAMSQALAAAGLKPQDIDYINAHGTGTPNNDLSEGTAIARLFGCTPPPVSSTKSFTGHTTSAAGGVEAVISLLALQHNFIPANLNFKEKMPELTFSPLNPPQGDFTPLRGEGGLRNVLSNSFGFGGNDTSLIFSKIADE